MSEDYSNTKFYVNIYTQKQRWKLLLLLAALMIGTASLWYTNRLVNKLAVEERKGNAATVAKATSGGSVDLF